MSMHPSLRGSSKGKKQKSVLKRIEKLKHLADKELWKEGDRVYGLPKIKTIKIKIKKEKVEKAAEAAVAGAEGQAAPAAAPAKAASAKETKEAKK